MNIKSKSHIVGIACFSVCTVAMADHCYREIFLGKACDLVNCEMGTVCNNTLEIFSNENAYITTSGEDNGKRAKTTSSFLCHQTWTELDSSSNCTIERSCSKSVNGGRAVGLACSHPSGPPV